jgi:hypothetical protein
MLKYMNDSFWQGATNYAPALPVQGLSSGWGQGKNNSMLLKIIIMMFAETKTLLFILFYESQFFSSYICTYIFFYYLYIFCGICRVL